MPNPEDTLHLILSTYVCYFSFPISPDTTDVQDAQVEYDSQNVTVTCHFAEGSQALGCHVQLHFSSDLQAHNISRSVGSLVAQREIKTQLPPQCYQLQLSVYDWEADGTVGTLPIPVKEMMFADKSSEACGTATGTSTPGHLNTGVHLITKVSSYTKSELMTPLMVAKLEET